MVNKTKSILNIFLIFILIVLLSSSVKAANTNAVIKTIKFGDVNEDGKVDIYDEEIVSNGNLTERQKIIADINMDKIISSEDTRLLSRIVNGSDSAKTIAFLGDVNYDLKVDQNDVKLITDYANNYIQPQNECIKFIADVNEDGILSKDDADLALKMATKIERLKLIEPGYTLKFIYNNRALYKKENNKFVKITTKNLYKNKFVVIKEIDSDFYNKNYLKIGENEYVYFNLACFKKVPEIEKGTVNFAYVGDVNFDLKVDKADADLIQKYATNKEQPKNEFVKFIADINKDGTISPEDAKLASVITNPEKIEKGYAFKFIYNYRALYKKENGKFIKITNKSLYKDKLVIIEEINADLYNKNYLKIGNNEYVIFNTSCFKKATEIEKGTAKYTYLGDVNGDLKVNDKDVELISKYVDDLETPNESVKFIADVNEDGQLNIDDYLLVQNMANGKEDLIQIGKGYTLRFIYDYRALYKKENGKFVKITDKSLYKNKLIVIQEINGDFYNNNYLKIGSNEFVLFNTTCFKKATEIDKGSAKYAYLGDVNGDLKIDSKDVKLISKYVDNLETPNESLKFIADINKDGQLTYEDVGIAKVIIDGFIIPEKIEKGYKLACTTDSYPIFKKEKANFVKTTKTISNGQFITIQEINGDFYNNNYLKIGPNEYILFNTKYLRPLTEIEKGTAKYTYLGDVNGDLKLDAADTALILKYATNVLKPKEIIRLIADVNEDGKLTYEDAKLAEDMANGKEKLIKIEKGYPLKVKTNSNIKIYKKENNKFIQTSEKKLDKVIIIQEISIDLYNNYLKIGDNEYIYFKNSYFEKTQRQSVINDEKNDIYIDRYGKVFTLYKQYAPEYKDVTYTLNGKKPNGTIKDSGCLPTSCCIISSGYGHSDTPKSIASNFYKTNSDNSTYYYFTDRNLAFGLNDYESCVNYYKQKKIDILSMPKNQKEEYRQEYFRNEILKALDYNCQIIISCSSTSEENWLLKIGGEQCGVEGHAYTILDKRTKDGKVEVFYSDPDGPSGWSTIDGFDHIDMFYYIQPENK